MKFKLTISVVLIMSLSGCSRVKGYFPDKEKDYQLTQEIPALIIPEDLTDDAIQNKPLIATSKVTERAVAKTVSKTAAEKQTIYVDWVEFSGGATRIRIEDSIARVWRTVGKALSRHSIEITSRNERERVYYVQYDPDFKEVEDGSLWDEALFIFGSDPANEKEFKVRLAENASLTEVIVLDSKDQPLSKGPGLKLLRLLYKTIKDDLATRME